MLALARQAGMRSTATHTNRMSSAASLSWTSQETTASGRNEQCAGRCVRLTPECPDAWNSIATAAVLPCHGCRSEVGADRALVFVRPEQTPRCDPEDGSIRAKRQCGAAVSVASGKRRRSRVTPLGVQLGDSADTRMALYAARR